MMLSYSYFCWALREFLINIHVYSQNNIPRFVNLWWPQTVRVVGLSLVLKCAQPNPSMGLG